MNPVNTIPKDRPVFCRLKSTGKLVITEYNKKLNCFEVIRDEIYYYQPEEFIGWRDLLCG